MMRTRWGIWFGVGLAAGLMAMLLLPGGETETMQSIGQAFHSGTSLTWRGALSTAPARVTKPPQHKSYPEATQVKLPAPALGDAGLDSLLRSRRSRRTFTADPLTLAQLSSLLFAAQGITGDHRANPALRTTPSAGALYPLEVYLYAHRVAGLEQGLYHYDVHGHALELLRLGALGGKFTRACLDQEMPQQAGVTFFYAAIFDRVAWKYGERGYRYAYIEVGHAAQNVALAVEALRLGAVVIGAFHDAQLNELLGLDGESEAALYVQSVGSVARR